MLVTGVFCLVFGWATGSLATTGNILSADELCRTETKTPEIRVVHSLTGVNTLRPSTVLPFDSQPRVLYNGMQGLPLPGKDI